MNRKKGIEIKVYALLILLMIGGVILFDYACRWYDADKPREVHRGAYKVKYEGLVRETVRKMVKPEALKTERAQ
jgi:hypothetical protein